MIIKKVFASIIFIGLAAKVWSHIEIESEDYFFPLEPVINFCKMSENCVHDFVPICGQDSLGITRMFNDNCDLFEYNCDEKKQYRHVKMKLCQYEAVAAPVYGLIIIGLAAEVWSHVEIEAEDYFFPLEPVINYCQMADECTHDFVPICGQDSLGVTRNFKDNCDLFEYNCDEKTQFQHVKLDVCLVEPLEEEDE